MDNPRTAYLIFIRPPGSQMWTQHMKPTCTGPIPWVSYVVDTANEEARRICDEGKYCARVVPVHHQREIDDARYALMADGDTRYVATP